MSGFRFLVALITGLFLLAVGPIDSRAESGLQYSDVQAFSACSPTGELLNLTFTVASTGGDFTFGATPPFVEVYADSDGSGDLSEGDKFLFQELLPGFLASGDQVVISGEYALPFALQTCPLLLYIADNSCDCGPFVHQIESVPYLNAGADLALCNGESGQLGCGPGVESYTYSWSAIGDADLGALSATDIADPLVTAVNATGEEVIWQYVLTTDKGYGSCLYTDTVSVFICPLRDTSVCEGEDLTLQLEQLQADSVVWTGPFAGSVYGLSLTIQDAGQEDAGQYEAVAYSNGCVVGKLCVFVGVDPAPEAPQPTYNGPICTFDTLRLYANVDADAYLWTGPDGFTSDDRDPVLTGLTAANTGVYSLVVFLGECASAAGSVAVELVPCDCVEFPDSVTLTCDDFENQTADYCLPLSFLDFISGYDLYIDGEVYFDLPFICDLDTAGGYDFTTVIENQTYGGDEKILLDWFVNGTDLVTTNFTYSTLEELAAFMQSLRPQGGWIAENDRIVGGLQTQQGSYGKLRIFSPGLGALAEINYNLGITSEGTLIEDIPQGCHWLTLVNVAEPLCPVDSIYVCVECGEPSVDIEKHTNGVDADEPIGPIILVDLNGETVEWTYYVKNTGDVDLIDLVVEDDREGTVCTIPFLAAGDSTVCTLTGDAVLGMYANVATVTGTPVNEAGEPTGDPVTDSDPSHYTGVWINVQKEADAEAICGEGEVNYTLTVRMLGGAPGIQIRNIHVVDNNLPDTITVNSPLFVGNDFNGNGWLDFVDNDGDGVSDEEFMFAYSLYLTESNQNIAVDYGEIWFQGPQGDFFVGAVGNSDTVNVEVIDPQEVTLNIFSCNPADTGTVVQVFEGANGCDSTVTTITELLPSYEITINETTCDPQQAGTFTETFTSSEGCDSIVTTIVELLDSYEITVNETTCDPQAAGTFTETFTASNGCDSTVTTIVELLDSYEITVNETTCDPQAAGTFTETFTASNGCDSIVTTIVELLDSYEITVNETTCDPQAAGTFTETFTSSEGCDSTVTTIVELLPSYEITVNETTCDPQQAGTFTETLTSTEGCDSIVTTIVELLPSFQVTVELTTCDPEEAGTFTDVLTASNGCDSTVTSIISWLPGPILPDSATVVCNDPVNQTGDYCLPLPFNDFVTGYDLYIDGEVYFDLPFICDLDTAGGYDFTTVINNNTYGGTTHILLSWTVNDNELVAEPFTYGTFDELAAFMQNVNPSGGWSAEDGDRIEGGLQNSSGIYGTIEVFSPQIGALAFVNYNLGIVSEGTLIEDIPAGCHWFTVVDRETGCADSTWVCVDCFEPPVTDTLIVYIPEDSTDIVCVDEVYDLESVDGSSVCNAGDLGVDVGDGLCVTITNDADGYQSDTICVVHCQGEVCDTTIIVVIPEPPVPVTDTLIVYIPEDSTDIVCVDEVYDLNGVDGASVCHADGLIVETGDGLCVTITNDNDAYQPDTICVVHCSGAICDTTIIIVIPEPPVVVTDTVIVYIPEDSTDLVCVEEFYDLFGITNAGVCDDGGLVLGGVADPFCVEITNDADGYQPDTICVFHCDGAICDTTIIIVIPEPPVPVTDTIIVYIPEDSIGLVCVDEVYDLNGVDGAAVCDAGDLEVVTSDDNLCVVIGNDVDGYQPDTICVVHCSGSFCDTTIIIVIPEPPVPVTDTVIVYIPEDSTDIVCIDEYYDFSSSDSASICDAGDLGVGVDNGDLCVTITNDNDGYQPDTICVVHCLGELCDTTIIVVIPEPPVLTTDTIIVTIPELTTDTVCVDDFYELGAVTSAGICDLGDGDIGVMADDESLCVVLGVGEDGYQNDTICVYHCDGAVCDTTIIIIHSNPPVPVTDTLIIEIPQDSTGTICLDDVFDGDPDQAGGVSVCNDNDLEVILDEEGLCVDITNDNDGHMNDTICVVHCDLYVCDTTIIIVVSQPGLPPVAQNDTATTSMDSTISISVLINDFDPDGGTITVTDIATDPQHGTVTINQDGTITYDPDPNYFGVDSFQYVICDAPFDGCDSAWVFITIESPECLFPEAFTPNGDGLNDFFEIRCLENQEGVSVKVFNRWGNEIYFDKDYRNNWDGKFEGKPLPDGAYFYLIEFDDTVKGIRTSRSGYIMIHR